MQPAVCSCVIPYIKEYQYVRKSIHTPDAQVLKSVHPEAKMCTKCARCTLYFEHCPLITGMYCSFYLSLTIIGFLIIMLLSDET